MSIQRVAIIFDNTARPETTGIYCRRALGKLVEVDHFLPSEIARIPKDYDVYLRIDDGFRYRLPPDLHPCACWAIDTHIDFEAAFEQSKDYDVVFAAQKDGTVRLREAGIGACWLPLACDPEMHQPLNVQKEFDWCFVGNLFPGPRQELIERLQQLFPQAFVGQRYFQEMCRAGVVDESLLPSCASSEEMNSGVGKDCRSGSRE